jgi:hypothetical protein
LVPAGPSPALDVPKPGAPAPTPEGGFMTPLNADPVIPIPIGKAAGDTKPADVAPGSLPPIPAATKPTDPTKPAPAPTSPGPVANDLLPPPPAAPAVKPLPTPPVPMKTEVAPPAADLLPPPSNPGVKPPATPTPTPPVVGASGQLPATGAPSAPAVLPEGPPAAPAIGEVPPSKPTVAPPAVAAVADVKFRIVLRVGEGEPQFEVKNGDNLVLKVACEKVDIKSPEKGGGLSEVTARGKVRFAGFGAEGTCEELKFFAGTGEVSMSGDVKVQVKDKLGRVESELTTATMKYKIDASAIGGALKP